jgi:hypothetical protein
MAPMNMKYASQLVASAVAGLLLLAGAASVTGQESPAPPKPAARAITPQMPRPEDQDAADDQPANNLSPDTQPLTSLQTPTLGSPPILHSYWIPGFQYQNFVLSSSVTQPGVSDWNSTSYLVGNVSVLESWAHSQLAANYSGGGSFSTDSSQGTNGYQQLGIVQSFNWQRLTLSLIDQFSYLPQSSFGFGAATSLATPGVDTTLRPPLPDLQSSYQPAQSIFASLGPRYSNSANAQIAYAISPRSSFTLAGSYAILRFVDPGNIDSNDTAFSAGYSYALSPRDGVGVIYRFGGYRFTGQPQAFDDQTVEVAYGRKITGRLVLQLFGGPDIITFRRPVNGSTSEVSGSGGANLRVALSRTTISLGYSHGVSGGSGQFTGSTADQLQTGISHQLTRLWQTNLGFGYARNKNLGIASPGATSQVFDSLFVAGGLSRPLGHTTTFSLAYTAYIQESGLPACTTGVCNMSRLQQQISAGFQWHSRPLVLR